ncbi:putative F-box/FBD/LRR-repeat protein At5g56810 isoform X2 [Prunus dulcis]|uniref:putative F-box/FBD/LRR-repeat protein At5g56810 isoform X2 n=1 Tax=Prunus dulcis TaxID=3755 RepID=UPI0014839188|nr:putative F-box/FBD/LRR-repeat protein At5g56810 isoform X2 [Prunus dulcis]
MIRQRNPRTQISSPRLTKKAKQEEEEDMIANLPDDVLSHILSLLPTKHAVATTVLSKKWTNLWTSASFFKLDLDDRLLLRPKSLTSMPNHASLFANFVNHVLGLINLPCVQKITFFCSDSYDSNLINSWLLVACTSNVVEVDIRIPYTQNPIELPQILYASRSLRVLKLNANIRLDFPPDCVCFPSLKVLWITVYNQDGITFTQKLFHICFVLEDLFMESDILNKEREVVFTVKSNTLKRLKIECLVHSFDIEYSFVVDCPNLEHLDLCDDFLAKYKIATDLKVLDDAKICIGLPSADYGAFELYFEAVSYSYETVEHTDSDENEDGIALRIRLRNFMLKFPFLRRLELGFRTSESWNIMTLLLHSSPNQQHLILRKELNGYSVGYKRFSYGMPKGSVPECLLCHLKEMEIWGFEGVKYDLPMVEFFLGNAEILQKMKIYVHELSSDEEIMLSEHVLEIPKVSEACQVEIKYEY